VHLTVLEMGFLAASGYISSWWLHPHMACPKCKGNSRKYGALHTTKFRFCHVCGGSGRAVRCGARLMVKMGFMKDPDTTGAFGWWWRNRRGR
jgi:hypothetical protein